MIAAPCYTILNSPNANILPLAHSVISSLVGVSSCGGFVLAKRFCMVHRSADPIGFMFYNARNGADFDLG